MAVANLYSMCNLYSMTRIQEAIRRLFRIARDLTGNLPPLPAIFTDITAPIMRVGSDGELPARNDALGHARTGAVRRTAGDEHSQHQEPALAPVARPGEPLPRAGDELLRMDR